jgi:hypothetical protein
MKRSGSVQIITDPEGPKKTYRFGSGKLWLTHEVSLAMSFWRSVHGAKRNILASENFVQLQRSSFPLLVDTNELNNVVYWCPSLKRRLKQFFDPTFSFIFRLRFFYNRLVTFMSSGPVLPMILGMLLAKRICLTSFVSCMGTCKCRYPVMLCP